MKPKINLEFTEKELEELIKVFQESSRQTVLSDKLFDRFDKAREQL